MRSLASLRRAGKHQNPGVELPVLLYKVLQLEVKAGGGQGKDFFCNSAEVTMSQGSLPFWSQVNLFLD